MANLESSRILADVRRLFFLTLICIITRTTSAGEPVDASGQLTLKVDANGVPGQVTLTVAVPGNIPARQEILACRYSHQPLKTYEADGNTYAVIRLLKPQVPTEVIIDVKARLYSGSLNAVVAGTNARWQEPKENLARWLQSEKWLEVDAPRITLLAARLKGPSARKTISNIQDFLAGHLENSGYEGTDYGALQTLERGKGDCSDFADLFVTLCRACGIPARTLSGYLSYIPKDTPKHDRAEAYLPALGWVRFDPFHTFRGHCTLMDNLPNHFVVDHLRNNEELQGYHFWRYSYQNGKDVKVSATWTTNGKTSASSVGISKKD